MSPDAELLRRYSRQNDERAFAELVQRHLGLVYAAALRRTGGRVQFAEDISQKVFTDLARKAAQLDGHPTLAGWLYRCTRNAAIDVMRAEQSSQRFTEAFAKMPDIAPVDLSVDWDQLRPVLDEAMDRLKERDREIMLLRFFNGLTFAEVGARLNLSENAARMRTERALDKLRLYFGQKGIRSTTAALGVLLTNQALVGAPVGLAATVTTTALSFAPVTSGFMTFFLMSKITAPVFSAVLAAGATALVWTSVMPAGVSATELAALRAENARLTQATAPGASTASVDAVAGEYAAQVTAIAQAVERRQAGAAVSVSPASSPVSSGVTPRGHRDHGTATAQDAAMTFAWAGDICDPEVFRKLIYFDSEARAKAMAVLSTMPEGIRAQYPTPEAFYGLLLAASCMEGPPPGADILEKFQIVELSPGRVSHRPPGSTRNNWEYQQTPDGWKYVLPEAGVVGLPSILNSQTLAKLAKH